MTQRLTATFDRLRAENRAGFIPYLMGGDPDLEASFAVLDALPGAGADIIELGFPFTDPTADGPSIEAAGRRALDAGVTLSAVLGLAQRFRDRHADTPLILMGYANPVHAMGEPAFAARAADAGADGVIIVDLPPEEDGALYTALHNQGLAVIRLATPTTDATRLPRVLDGAAGFVYYVSSTGVTGAVTATAGAVADGLSGLRAATRLPIAVGFGVRTPDQAAAIARGADAVVVGSALVEAVHADTDEGLSLARALANAVHAARADVEQ